MTSPTKQRTFSPERWAEAQEAWRRWEADASSGMIEEWAPWRRLAAGVAGIIDPPVGGRYDSWLDDHPSQLAILTRAIRESPEALREAIGADDVRSWFDVVGGVLEGLNARAAEVEARATREEAAWAATKAAEREAAPVALRRLGWPPQPPGAGRP